LAFEQPSLTINIGQEVSVKLKSEPVTAKGNPPVTYRASQDGLITISGQSNDGCVIRADKGGSVVLIAKAGEVTAYLEVQVSGVTKVEVPYIVIPTQVIELSEGSRRSVQVSLYGGTTLDNAAFEWKTESRKDNISIENSTNTVVVNGVKRGSQKIFISHPKAEHTAEILVFVLGVNEEPKYITTNENVLVVEKDGANKQFSVNLVNGRVSDRSGFIYEVVENPQNITIITTGEVCSVVGLAKGTSVIRVSHPLADYTLEVIVFVVLGEVPHIVLDKSFVLLKKYESTFVAATIEGSVPASAMNDYTYGLSNNGVVTVTQTNNQFFIESVETGSTVLTIENENVEYSREVLIVVRGDNVVAVDGYYITTSQNVIQMEIGQEPVALNMLLVGGVEADKNSFNWVVEDSRIIEVETAHGNVSYERRIRAAGDISGVFNGVAMITPKKAGTSKIIISHPKSPTTGNVMVKVYPRGTFEVAPIIVGTAGLLKIVKGSPVDVTLDVLSGQEKDVGILTWSVEDTGIASVTGGNGLTNQITGIASGTTKLHVTGVNLKTPHESLLLVGTQAEINARTYIYVDNVYQTLYTGQSIYLQLQDSNGSLSNSNKYYAVSSDSGKLYATVIKSRLLLQGVTPGEVTVTVTNEDAENSITIHVTVESDKVTIDKPYTITAPNFYGMVRGRTELFSVTMAGAGSTELDKIKWSSENSGVVSVTGNGEEAQLQAVALGQTRLTVFHAKSSNEKVVVVYVVASEAELNNRVLLGVAREYYLMQRGEEFALHLITNANDYQKSQIVWSNDDLTVVSLDSNGDSAFIRAVGVGSTKITVTHPDNIVPLILYISVSNMAPGSKTLAVPSSIEMIVGENKVITAETIGLSGAEIAAITWSIDDPAIANVSSDGDKSYVLGKKKGQAFITVRLASIGYEKKILLVCANSYEELESTYIIAAPETYYRIAIGDVKNIELLFGSAGFPETALQDIAWSVENNNVVSLQANGKKARIEGINAGVAKVTATSSLTVKPVEITIEVNRTEIAGENYVFNYSAMQGIVLENSVTIAVSITPDGAGNALIEYENQNDAIVTVSQAGGGNEFYVTAVGIGQSYLTLRHPKVVEPARILIYTAATQEALENAFPIALSKTNYLISIGGKERIKIETPSEDTAKLNKIKWSLDNNGIVSYTVISKKEIEIEGVATGNCIFSISYDNTVVEQAYVSVKSNMVLDSSKRIATEGIVGLVKGQSKQTGITSNLTTAELAQLEWQSENMGKVTVEPVLGNTGRAMLQGVSTGETYVTVQLGDIKRHILVYVCNTQAEVDAYKAMNIDNQYYQLKRGQELTLSVFYAAVKPTADTEWEDVYDNNVVKITPNGAKAQIKGENEGIGTIRVSNSQCATPVTITVEVSNDFAGTVGDNTELWYLSTSKTVYVLNPDYPLETVTLQVNPVGFAAGEETNIKWEKHSGSSLVQLYPAGASCTVGPGGGEGTAVIRVSHARSSNFLDIQVIVTREELIDETMPYISLSDDIIRVAMGGQEQVPLSILNVVNPDISGFTVTSNNANATVSVVGNMMTVRGVSYGQALITISHPSCQYSKKVVVIVTTTDDGLLYLTTENNYSVIETGDYKAVEVELVGFDETNNSRYHWEADSADDAVLVDIQASGKKAIITGKAVGTAKIKITHEYCMYPLYIYARITEIGGITPVYITTSNNIVSIVDGNSMTIEAELVNGLEAEHSLFQWSTDNKDLIELNYSGNSALIRGIGIGTASITIAHPASMNSINIIVVVEEDSTQSGIYITTATQLVELKPTDASRRIDVRLVGGSAEDIYGFQWQIVDYVSLIKNKDGTSKPVVTLVANADNAYVMPTQNEGEATIRVTHPKTAYRLDIKVMVQLTTNIEFESSTLTLDMLTSKSVQVESPTGITVIYESSDDSIATAVGTDKVCIIEGYKQGTVIITARNASGTASDEIVVQVKFVDTSSLEYIDTSTNLLTLNTNMTGVTVNAKLVSAKNPGTALPETEYLVYESQNKKVATTFGNGPSTAVNPVEPGITEIHIKYNNPNDPNCELYPSLKNYVKRVYIKVEMDEMVFTISETFIQLAEGEKATLTVTLENESDVNYQTDIVWASSNPGVVGVGLLPSTDRGLVQIVGTTEGQAEVTATYKGSIRSCTVEVLKPKRLSLSASSITLSPGMTLPSTEDPKPITVTLSPSNATFTVVADNYNSIEYECSSNKDGAQISIRAKEAEGTTVLEFRGSNGLTANLVIQNVKNYQLRWIGRATLRADPYVDNDPLVTGLVETYQGKRWHVLKYEIMPGNDILKLVRANAQFADVVIDNTAKKVYVRPVKAGSYTLTFEGTTNQVQIDLPIYFGYENIDLKWTSTRTYMPSYSAITLHSKFDTAQNAIYLADKEKITISINMSDLESRYPNNGLTLNASGEGAIQLKTSYNPALSGSDPGSSATSTSVTLENPVKGPGGFLQESLWKVDYWGFVTVQYGYYNGGTNQAVFKKTFLLYYETWRRSR
jgi:hypothetical protein